MIDQHTWYDVLGVEPDAPTEKIKALYRLRTKLVHPDLNAGNDVPQKLLNEAYEVLGDPDKRKEYNQQAGFPTPRKTKPGKPTYQEIQVNSQQANQPIFYSFRRWEPCDRCWGEGCSRCQYKGKTLETVNLTVSVPVGVSQMVIGSQGTRVEPGGSRGDLILYVIWSDD